jgi:type II secretory pathway pseudopilin PulG
MQTGKPVATIITASSLRHKQRGFGYLMVLFSMAALGLLLASVGTMWHTASMREKEQQLLFVGQQYRQALMAYYRATPTGQAPYPLTLQELLLDTRAPQTVRHLRKLYPDPMTGSADWGLVRQQGRIVGVYSQSTLAPYQTHFDAPHTAFEGASRYADWVFRIDDALGAM